MCIRDSFIGRALDRLQSLLGDLLDEDAMLLADRLTLLYDCLLYTSDAADERSSVDLGGRRIIKKKHKTKVDPLSFKDYITYN